MFDARTNVAPSIGQATQIDFLEIKWSLPSGETQRFTGLPLNRYIAVKARVILD